MPYRWAIKAAMIGIIVLGLQWALSLIAAQISARAQLQGSVEADIANTAAGPQTVVGPFLVLEWQEPSTATPPSQSATDVEAAKAPSVRKRWIAAKELQFKGQAEIEPRFRGLYHANLFRSQWQLQGMLAVDALADPASSAAPTSARAYLVMGLSDQRGISSSPSLQVAGEAKTFQPGSQNTLEGPAIYADLGTLDLREAHRIPFEMQLDLMGTSALAIAPTAEQTSVSLDSNWPHPSFQGRFLPTSHSLSDSGFSAQWQISHLARNFEKAIMAGSPQNNEWLQIRFVDPVNIYQQ